MVEPWHVASQSLFTINNNKEAKQQEQNLNIVREEGRRRKQSMTTEGRNKMSKEKK